jgi:hypothetical protein
MGKRPGGTQPALLNKPESEFVLSLFAHFNVFLNRYSEKYHYLRNPEFENITILLRIKKESGLKSDHHFL